MASESTAVGSGNGNGAAGKAAASFGGFKPQLLVPGQKADEAVQFYKAAFGAKELSRATHPKRKADQEANLILCAELKIGASSLLVCDQTEGSAAGVKVEASSGGMGILFRLETDDVQGAVAKAVEAGAAQESEIVEDEGACGGGLVGKVKDPFGVVWAIASSAVKCVFEAEA